MRRLSSCTLPTTNGPLTLRVYGRELRDDRPWVACSSGDLDGRSGVMLRVHDACMTSEVLGSLKCDCAMQLRRSQALIAQRGGVLIYTPQEGRGIGLAQKVAAYALQEERGLDTVDANRALGLADEERDYACVPLILADHGVQSVKLVTNNPFKVEQLSALGITVESCEPIWAAGAFDVCSSYLTTKIRRMGHAEPEEQLLLCAETEDSGEQGGSEPSRSRAEAAASTATNSTSRRGPRDGPPQQAESSRAATAGGEQAQMKAEADGSEGRQREGGDGVVTQTSDGNPACPPHPGRRSLPIARL